MVCFILGGDWNCTTDFILDKNQNKHQYQSGVELTNVINGFQLFEVWRAKHIKVKHYTWLKVADSIWKQHGTAGL